MRERLFKLVAKRSGSWPPIAVADATRLPFSDRSFDSALSEVELWRAYRLAE